MKGDFSRVTFDPKKGFSQVLMQMGRVQLDADWNEQGNILLHFIRTLAMDLIGPHGGPGDGFKISPLTASEEKDRNKRPDWLIERGHYYVEGILCENDGMWNGNKLSYFNQPYYKAPSELPSGAYVIYLDVWERHVTCFEDKSLCDDALGGVDTATRAQTVWQVKCHESPADKGCQGVKFPVKSTACMAAQAAQAHQSEDPCNIEPDASYRGAENQLYRVEIHTGNTNDMGELDDTKKATFKWSRENGCVVFSVTGIAAVKDDGNKTRVSLVNLGRDDKSSLREGDMVEILDDDHALSNDAKKLLKVLSIDHDDMSVVLDGKTAITVAPASANHAQLRRWDHKRARSGKEGITWNEASNTIEVTENTWLPLEDGIQVQFSNCGIQEHRLVGKVTEKEIEVERTGPATYRTGDYWLIPARTSARDVEWPKDAHGPVKQPSRGVKHHYAPLAFVPGIGAEPSDCRCTLNPIKTCPQGMGGPATPTETRKQTATKKP
jgi:hypothetical protein